MAEGRIDRDTYPSNICPHALRVSLYITQDKAADGKETGRQSLGKQFGCRLVPKTGGQECLLQLGVSVLGRDIKTEAYRMSLGQDDR